MMWRSTPAQGVIERPGLSARVLLSGQEDHDVGGRTYRLTADDVMLLWPGAPISYRATGAEPTSALAIELPVSSELEGPLVDALVLPAAAHPIGSWLRETALAFMTAHDGRALSETALRQGRAALPTIAEDVRRKLGRIDAEKLTTQLDRLRRVEVARVLMESGGRDRMPLSDLARRVGLSPFHLARTFSQVHGVPPAAYHRRLRLDRAAEFIKSGATLAQAAAACGYSEPASLARALKNHLGR